MTRVILAFCGILFFAQSDPAYGNSFFKQLAGTWKVSNANYWNSGGAPISRSQYTMRIQLQKDGTLYAFMTGRLAGAS